MIGDRVYKLHCTLLVKSLDGSFLLYCRRSQHRLGYSGMQQRQYLPSNLDLVTKLILDVWHVDDSVYSRFYLCITSLGIISKGPNQVERIMQHPDGHIQWQGEESFRVIRGNRGVL